MTATATRNLSVALRPRRFSEIVGYDALLGQVVNQFTSGRLPTAVMFYGPAGTGKTTLARIIARSVNCNHAVFGEPCDACLEERFDIIEHNAAVLSTVDDTRTLLEILPIYPQCGDYRVLILDELQQMSKAAQNALLKNIEDAASFNIFLLCTTEAEKIEKAVRSRCTCYHIPGMDHDNVARLVSETMRLAEATDRLAEADPLVRLLWEREITSPRHIVTAVERLLNGAAPEQAAVADETGNVDIGKLCYVTIRGDWNAARALLENAKPADGAPIRMALSSFFRKKLLTCDNTLKGLSRAKTLSDILIELTDHNTPETGLQLSAMCASIYRICQMTKTAAAQANLSRAA